MSDFAGTVQKTMSMARAYRMACIFLIIALLIVGVVAINASSQQRTVLVPFGLYRANSSVKVTGNPVTDSNYISILAEADLDALLTWQPLTVNTQVQRFLMRLSPDAYRRYNLTLRQRAEKFSSENISEVFYPKRIVFKKPVTYVISGTLVRYTGDTESLKTPVTYTLTYGQSAGVYAIQDLKVSK